LIGFIKQQVGAGRSTVIFAAQALSMMTLAAVQNITVESIAARLLAS
jgi:hypothetical protein